MKRTRGEAKQTLINRKRIEEYMRLKDTPLTIRDIHYGNVEMSIYAVRHCVDRLVETGLVKVVSEGRARNILYQIVTKQETPSAPVAPVETAIHLKSIFTAIKKLDAKVSRLLTELGVED